MLYNNNQITKYLAILRDGPHPKKLSTTLIYTEQKQIHEPILAAILIGGYLAVNLWSLEDNLFSWGHPRRSEIFGYFFK
jgi:hypothetical protein